jgi:hypothetical protein
MLALACLAAACTDRARDAPDLRVEYAGCVDVVAEACVPPPDGRMTLWIDAPSQAQVVVTSDGAAPQVVIGPDIQGGVRYDVELAPGTRALVVHARGARGERTWRLALAPAATDDALAAARAAVEAGDVEGAQALLAAELETRSAEAAGHVHRLLARVLLRAGDPEAAQAHLADAIAAHRAAGRRAALVNDATMLVFLQLQQRRFADARALLESLAPGDEEPAESRYLVDYYRGVLARYTGDARTALRRYEAAAAQAERIGRDDWRRAAEDQLATQLQALGRRAEADAMFARLLREAPDDLDDCARAQLLTNAGWNRLLALEAGEPAEDPTPMLTEALALYAQGCDREAERLVNARLNLALAALHAARADEASEHLAAAAASNEGMSADLLLWLRDLEGRIALSQHDPPRALAAYRDLERLAAATSAPESQWRAAFGAAQAHVALGARDEALAEYARAERLLDEESLQVPMQEGRETFAARREHATREYVALLLDAGRAADALDVVRAARSRALRALYRQDRLAQLSPEERARWDETIGAYLAQRDAMNRASADDWQLSAEALRDAEAERAAARAALARALDDAFLVLDREPRSAAPPRAPAPGEVVLAYHPLPTGWAAFAATAEETRAVTLSCVDGADGPEALARCVLEPFHAQIAAATQVRVLPYGVLRNVDFHALPFAGDVLLAAAPVVYGLDLPADAEADDVRGRALVVADPRGNLPAARREAAVVTAALAAGNEWTAETLAGPAALASTLRERLADIELFHYAGHAEFGGPGGWDSVLPLAQSSELTLGDVLALPHAPRWVVLSGCETGRAGTAAPAESLGLAQAFLAAGSRSVLAAVRPVADETAAALVDAYYRAWSRATSGAAALRSAQLALRARDPQADWASFRILER